MILIMEMNLGICGAISDRLNWKTNRNVYTCHLQIDKRENEKKKKKKKKEKRNTKNLA